MKLLYRMTAAVLLAFAGCAPAYALSFGDTVFIPTENIVTVYDGDTIYVNIPDTEAVPCSDPIACSGIGLRQGGIDLPEIKGACVAEKAGAYAAKGLLEYLLSKSDGIEAANLRKMKFAGRYGADLTVIGFAHGRVKSERIELGPLFLSLGMARPYEGGKRQPWCNEPAAE